MTKYIPPPLPPGFDPSKPLEDPKEEKFVSLMVSGEKIGDAYVQAGYKDASNGYRKKQEPQIKARLDWYQSQKAEKIRQAQSERLQVVENAVTNECVKVALTKSLVIDYLIENAQISMGKKMVKIKRKVRGKLTEWESTLFNGPAANKALELLGREIGMFNEKNAPPDSDTKKVQAPKEMDTERLMQLVASMRDQKPGHA